MFRAAVLFVLLIAATPVLAEAAWRIVPDASELEVTFTQGARQQEARYERFTGDILFDPADLARSRVEIRIDLSSFTTGDGSVDAQARGRAWLNADGDATAVYRALAFRRTGDAAYEVDAEMTVRGITRRITHPATVTIDGDLARTVGTVPLVRTEFGVGAGADPNGQTIGLEVVVRFDVQARRV
jgi:polyisoprenoid-binding protein YceI